MRPPSAPRRSVPPAVTGDATQPPGAVHQAAAIQPFGSPTDQKPAAAAEHSAGERSAAGEQSAAERSAAAGRPAARRSVAKSAAGQSASGEADDASTPRASRTGDPAAPGPGAAPVPGNPSASGDSAGRAAEACQDVGAPAAGPGSIVGPHVRVDARALESALVNLRKRIAAVPLLFEAPNVAEAKAERGKLLSQVDDYLLPRLRRSAAPILVSLVGSTGSGKSTLVNSIVGMQVSATGVRRPTTNSPVLACHPDDVDWFAENNFLPSLPRVRQEGLARPGRDGLLVLAATEGMPKGLALLDTPDIDSIVKAHHEFAYQFLDASDLWLFVTSASRYADAPVWHLLQHARDRGASLGIVLSRVPAGSRAELVGHFTAMLDANGIKAGGRFVLPETRIAAGMLPPEAFGQIRAWLTDTARRNERRVAVLTQNDVRRPRHVPDQGARSRRGCGGAAGRPFPAPQAG